MSIEVEAARAGATVLYVADRASEALDIINTEADSNSLTIASVRRTPGAGQIRYSNGGRLVCLHEHPRAQRVHG